MLAVGTLGSKMVAGGLLFVGTVFGGPAVLSHHPVMSQSVVRSMSNLTVSYQSSPSNQTSFKISCLAHTPSGTHPNAKAICAAIAKRGTSLFAPVPAGTACSQIYGGPETAKAIGTVNGHKINSAFSRTDGCQVARWNIAKTLFTFPGYATVHGRIELSPTCPGPVRPGQNCTNPSVSGTVIFSSNDRRSVTATAFADTGYFVLLHMGIWAFTGSSTSAMHCATGKITVRNSLEVVVTCDTGMR
jgi:hypothetical protein